MTDKQQERPSAAQAVRVLISECVDTAQDIQADLGIYLAHTPDDDLQYLCHDKAAELQKKLRAIMALLTD